MILEQSTLDALFYGIIVFGVVVFISEAMLFIAIRSRRIIIALMLIAMLIAAAKIFLHVAAVLILIFLIMIATTLLSLIL